MFSDVCSFYVWGICSFSFLGSLYKIYTHLYSHIRMNKHRGIRRNVGCLMLIFSLGVIVVMIMIKEEKYEWKTTK